MLPYRKPKRIRTAFSPNQLLKLEEAFEKNHYVVGAERKQLAASLNLTETQVSSQSGKACASLPAPVAAVTAATAAAAAASRTQSLRQ